MSASPEHTLSRFAVADARPATFLERGVTVPFTTPMLLGARARPAERRGLELVIANPAGVRGSYIVPLASLTDVCTPTLHDRLLCEAVEATPAITPDRMLQIARDVARRGMAGRATAAAASAADRADLNQRLFTNFRLLLHLVEQTERPGEHPILPARDTPASVEQRARRAIARTAPTLRVAAETIVAGLEALADVYVPVGFRGDPTKARYQRQLADLEMLAASVTSWAATAVDGQESSSAALIARSAELTLNCARPVMKELIDNLDNIGQLVLRWSSDSGRLMDLIARPAWLLDGWAVLVGIWRNGSEAGRSTSIREMAMLVPTMPIEADGWAGGNEERFDSAHRARSRFVFRLQEWRTGNAVELIARNEKLVKEAV